ncbi:ATP-dependent Clp protease ATP-binding subunit CLPT1, chloroplastic-like isoform X2 [Aristolochia californica]|uniref:ATP-dependent Clp protease ATP-binding subunit CLPT1, chloroplastic-like isoform X2 n=1 Tax=Aristolochia californica TaxID=171875 RepID=UPI0035D5E4C6
MASLSLSLLPVSSSFSSLDTRKIAPSSLLVIKYQKVNGLTSSLFESSNLRPSNLQPITRRRTSSSTTIFFMLPTAKPDRAPAEKIPKWSARAIKSFAMAELEARKLKYSTTGTEALLMGILIEGTSFAARFLRAHGIMLSKVREETVKLLGKSDMYYFSPEHPPLTEPAQRALDWAIDDNLNSGEGGEATTIQMLRGIWSEESAGHKILATLGFDDEKAKELAKYMVEDAVLTYR